MALREWGERLLAVMTKKAKGKRKGKGRPARPRGRPGWYPGEGLAGLQPLLAPEDQFRRFDDLRRHFPVLDVAVAHLIRLVGKMEIDCRASDRPEWEAWLAGVRVNQAGRGLQAWLEAHLDALLVYGFGVGEIVLERGRHDLFALLNLDSRTIRFRAGPDPLTLAVTQCQQGRLEPVPLYPPLTLVSVRNPQSDNPYGVSIFRSLLYVAEAASLIQNATVQAWIRMGNPSFHVNWRSGAEFADPQGSISDEVIAELQTRFNEAMGARNEGNLLDFFTSGVVEVSTIGSDGHLQSLREPLRVFVEQLVSATGLPPWLLGLHWSATERLSLQQADLLVATIEGLRRTVHPQLEYLVEFRRRLRDLPGPVTVRWAPVDLRDLTEQSRAALLREQARARRIENARRMWELGFWSQSRAAREADGE